MPILGAGLYRTAESKILQFVQRVCGGHTDSVCTQARLLRKYTLDESALSGAIMTEALSTYYGMPCSVMHLLDRGCFELPHLLYGP